MLKLDICLARRDFMLEVNAALPLQGNIALIGESGSGKTSLLRVLAGLEPATGTLGFGLQQWLSTENGQCMPPQQRHVGYVFQDYALFSHMSVQRNVTFGVIGDAPQTVAHHWLSRLGIAELAERMPATLSGGQKQRVALARALASSPQCLLLDEPFSALDTSLKLQLRRELKKLLDETGIPLVLATHDIQEAQYFCDQALLLQQGGVMAQGSPAQMIQQPATLAIARMLGWHNVIELSQNVQVSLPWGSQISNTQRQQYSACAIKPSSISICSPDTAGACSARVIRFIFSQTENLVELEGDAGQRFYVSSHGLDDVSPGDTIGVKTSEAQLLWFE